MSEDNEDSTGLKERTESVFGGKGRDTDFFNLRSAGIALVGTLLYILITQTFFPQIYRDLGILVPLITIYFVVTMYDI